jgi:hypothetical protein
MEKVAIEVDAEGIPLDKGLRAVVLRIRSYGASDKQRLGIGLRRLVRHHLPHLLSEQERELDREEVAARRSRSRRRYRYSHFDAVPPVDVIGPVVDSVIESMLATGRLERTSLGTAPDGAEDWEYSFPNARNTEKTPEARAANWKAAVDGIVQRVSDDEAVQERARTLFLQARNIYGSHPVETRYGRSVLVPQGFDLTVDGPVVTSAILFTDAPGGVQIRTGKRVSVAWDGVVPALAIGKGFRISRKLERKFASERLSPRGTYVRAMSDVAIGMWRSSSYYKGKKHLVSKILGEELDDLRWRKFLKAIQRSKDLRFLISSHVFKMLDPVARRAALRNPFATFSTYAWFRSTDEQTEHRRQQAAESYPFITGRLEQLAEKIDAGAPLAEPVAGLVGMTTIQLRSLGTLHWQRLGRVIHDLKSFREQDFRGVPPERMPRSKKDWALYMDRRLSSFRRQMPAEMAALFNKAASNDLAGYTSLLSKDLTQALYSTAGDLLPLMTGHLHMRADADWRAHMAFLSMIGGESFGLKRLRRFNEQWHAGTIRRTAVLRARRRKAFNGFSARWRPLVDGDFVSENGTLRFLVDEDQLVAEGQFMHHCVGSYVGNCVSGHSHIATVEGSRGGRSTVELVIANGGICLEQHHTYYDRAPPEDCVATVDDFLSEHVRETFDVVAGESGRSGYGVSIEADEEILGELRDLFSDCVPSAILAMDKKQWAEVMSRFEQPRADPAAYDEEDDYGRYW